MNVNTLLRQVFNSARAYRDLLSSGKRDVTAAREALLTLVADVALVEVMLDFHEMFEFVEGNVALWRWKPAKINHHPDCTRTPGERWTTCDTDRQSLKHDEVKAIVEYAKTTFPEITARLSPRKHEGRCEACGGESCRVSLKVELCSGERRMVREYAL